jgi:hypothetical protein
MFASPEHRARFIAGLRELADYLDTHGDVPVPDYPHLLVHVDGGSDAEERQAVDAAARGLGTRAAESLPGSGHYKARRDFGPLKYEVLAISRACMADYDARQSYAGNVITAA